MPAHGRPLEMRDLRLAAAPDGGGHQMGQPRICARRGVILFVLSAHKPRSAFVFTPSTREAFDGELEDFETGKGSVKIGYNTTLPTELLTRMIHYWLGEFEEDGVLWM